MVRTVEVTIPGAQGATGSIPGATEFTQLTDTPSTYSGQGQKVVRVNAGETALEFTAPPRTRLTADTTFYVRTDGSDGNDGLSNTSAGAFLTPQYAYDYICKNIDGAGYNIIVQVGDGQYSGNSPGWHGIYTSQASPPKFDPAYTGNPTAPGAVIMMYQAWVGAKSFMWRGNTTTPTSCFIGNDHGCCFNICGFALPGPMYIEGFKVQALHEGIIHSGKGHVVISDNMSFSACSIAHIYVEGTGAVVSIYGDYTITGGAPRHWIAEMGGAIQIGLQDITVSGTPSIGTFAEAQFGGAIWNNFATVTGAYTGRSYRCQWGGIIADCTNLGTPSLKGGWSWGQGMVKDRENNRQSFVDETRTSTTTLAAITDDISIDISVNEAKAFKWRIWYDTPTAADFKFDITGPASPTKLSYIIRYAAPDDTSMTTTGVNTAYNVVTTLTATTGTRGYIEIEGLVNNGSTAGTMYFRFAQATSNVSATSVLAGSDLWTNTMGGVI